MAGIFASPMTQPGMELRSAMALDDDGRDGKAVDPDKSDVLKQKPGITQAASGAEDDPWNV